MVQDVWGETTMKIHVNQVPAEGLRDRVTYDPTTMDMDRADIHPTDPCQVEAFIVKADQELVVNADIRAPLQMTCARCLEGFVSTVTTDAVFSYKVHPTDVVDITEDVRQEIILAYPMVPICQPGCKGLCSACGQNLNLGVCSHHTARQVADDRSRGDSEAR